LLFPSVVSDVHQRLIVGRLSVTSGLASNPAHREITSSSGRLLFQFFFLKKQFFFLKKSDLTRPKVSKNSLTSRPEVIVVFHREYKRTVTDTLNLSHCRAAGTTEM
jgi:hypothetical protein